MPFIDYDMHANKDNLVYKITIIFRICNISVGYLAISIA